jgi:hypothetical protein
MPIGFFSNTGVAANNIQLKCACNAEGVKNLNYVVTQLAAFSKINFAIVVEESLGASPAISIPNAIIVSRKLLDQPLSAIAFVMAHEWGHQAFGHTGTPTFLRSPVGRQFDEDSADSYAVKFYIEHGYDMSDVYQFNATFFPDAEERNQKIAMSHQLNARTAIAAF